MDPRSDPQMRMVTALEQMNARADAQARQERYDRDNAEMMAIAAYSGWKAWEATGDRRLAARTGVKMYLLQCLWFGLGMVSVVTGIFSTAQPAFLLIFLPSLVGHYGMWRWIKDVDARPHRLGHYNAVVPPPAPPAVGGGLRPKPVWPSTPPKPVSYRYGYDLTTGRFTREIGQ